MKKKNPRVKIILIFAALIFSAAVCGFNAPDESALKFSRTDFYSGGGYFDGVTVSAAGNLSLEASKKFMALESGEKDNISIEAAALWKKISGVKSGAVLVEIREQGKRTALWKSDGDDSAEMIEQWGPQIVQQSKNSIFMSAAVSGNSQQSGPVISGTLGSYFLYNMLDCAVNLSASGTSADIGLSGRCHYQLDHKWDLNGGIGFNFSGSSGSATGELMFLLGASEFLNYRSSLDFTASVGTAGDIMLGSGVTYYFDRIPWQETPAPAPAGRGAQPENTPEATLTPEDTFTVEATQTPTLTPEDTFSPTMTLQPEKNLETPQTVVTTQPEVMIQLEDIGKPSETPQAAYTQQTAAAIEPENTQQPVSTPQAENTQQPVAAVQPENTQQPVATPQAENTQQSVATPRAVNTQQPVETLRAVNTQQPAVTVQQVEAPTSVYTQVVTPESTPVSAVEAPSSQATPEAENVKEGTTAGLFIEADLYNGIKSLTNNWKNLGGRIGFGTDGIFGMSLIPVYMEDNRTQPLYQMAGLDLALDFYPFGRSPSGLYIGPVIGGRHFNFNPDPQSGNYGGFAITENNIQLSAGGEAGIRLLAGRFVIDASAAYNKLPAVNQSDNWPEPFTDNIRLSASAGFMFYAADNKPDNKKEDSYKPEEPGITTGSGDETGTAGVTTTTQSAQEQAVKNSAAGVFFEVDGMRLKKYLDDGIDEANFRFGFGDGGIFGMSFIFDGKYYQDGIFDAYVPGFSLGFNFYPFGNSPAGLYLGPVIGGKYNLDDNRNAPPGTPVNDYTIVTAGGEAGIRILMNWLVLDAGAEYDYDTKIYPSTPPAPQSSYDLIYRAELGFMFYSNPGN